MQAGANIVLAIVGYLLAVLVSSFVFLSAVQIIGVLPDLIRNGIHFESGGSYAFAIKNFFSFLFAGCMLTGITALPGFILTLIAAHFLKTDHLVYFSVSGVLTAILAVFVLGYGLGDRSMMNDLLSNRAALCIGGASGGFVYGLFARRNRIFRAQATDATDHA